MISCVSSYRVDGIGIGDEVPKRFSNSRSLLASGFSFWMALSKSLMVTRNLIFSSVNRIISSLRNSGDTSRSAALPLRSFLHRSKPWIGNNYEIKKQSRRVHPRIKNDIISVETGQYLLFVGVGWEGRGGPDENDRILTLMGMEFSIELCQDLLGSVEAYTGN